MLGGVFMYDALDVAAYIVHYCKQKKWPISNLKLQKILYFVQAQFLVARGEPCFYNGIEAWDFGPVVPEVYHEYKIFGSSNIIQPNNKIFSRNISEDDRNLIEIVVSECNDFSASQLIEITHNQSPWVEAYQEHMNNIITNEAIQQYFNEG